MPEKLKKSQHETIKYISEQTGKPAETLYNPKTGKFLKPFKDFITENPDTCIPIRQTIIKECTPSFDDLVAGKITPKVFGEQCSIKVEEVRAKGICYTARKGMEQPKALKEYIEKAEKVRAEMKKAGIINKK